MLLFDLLHEAGIKGDDAITSVDGLRRTLASTGSRATRTYDTGFLKEEIARIGVQNFDHDSQRAAMALIAHA